MLRSISSKQLREWMAYSELEPWDEGRADARSASICAAVYNVHRNQKRHPQPFQVKDFVLNFGDAVVAKTERQSDATMKSIAKMWVQVHNEAPDDGR